MVSTTLPQQDNDISNKHTADTKQRGTSAKIDENAEPSAVDQDDVENKNGETLSWLSVL